MWSPYGIRQFPCFKCGHQARLVICGVGSYVRCPHCEAGTYMCATKEEAESLWNKKKAEYAGKGHNMIQEIELSKLRVHPKNVRKAYNDIDELADSIRSQGILQNLTVVKNPEEEGTYWVVIGNRRLTAAQKAGLKTAPCQIVEMDEKDQASTMLLENMQRSDLTIHEQAYGIQMVLDLGETEESLSEKTGLSKTTIRHRSNIAKLNQDILQEKENDDGFQLTLRDLYELEKIPDVKKRDKILKEAANSNDLASKARQCVEEAKRKENEKKFKALFKKMGIKPAPDGTANELWSGKWDTVKEYELEKDVPQSIKISKEECEKCFFVVYYRSMKVIKKREKAKKQLTPEEIKQKAKEKRKKQVKALLKEMSAERKSFIHVAVEKNFKPEKMTPEEAEKRTFNFIIECGGWFNHNPLYEFLFDKSGYEAGEDEKQKAQKFAEETPLYLQLLVYANKAAADKETVEWNGTYRESSGSLLLELDAIMEDFGFRYSDGQYKQINDGTHELYKED